MKKIVIVISAAILVMACASAPSAGSAVPASAANKGSPPAEQIEPGAPAAAVQVPMVVNRVPSFKIRESVYFTTGVLDEYIVSTWDGGNLMTESRYSASETMLEKSEYRYNGARPIMKTTRVVDDGKEQVRAQVMYEYAQNNLQRETLKNGAGIVISSYEYGYDEAGNCTSWIMKNTKGAVMAQTVYTYTNRKLMSSETKNAAGDRINSAEYRYDAQGNRIRQETRNSSGDLISVLSAVWQNGLEIKEELTGADNKLQLRETNEYNTNGDMVKKTIEDLQGNSVQIVQYEYKLTGQ